MLIGNKLLTAAAALIAIAACQKNIVTETVTVNLTADITSESRTKAVADDDGNGKYVDRCLLQVWCGNSLYCQKTATMTDGKTQFNDISLLKDQTYDFLLWADNSGGNFYNTDTLTNVRIKEPYLGGDDRKDAFFGALTSRKVSNTFSESVTLHRPFAQLNIITTDLSEQIDGLLDSVFVTVTVPTVFNVRDSTVSKLKEVTYGGKRYGKTVGGEGNRTTLAMDYYLAPDEVNNVVEVKFATSYNQSGLVKATSTYSNIPLKRNYRTNVVGSLLIDKATINVEIDPIWDGEEDKEI